MSRFHLDRLTEQLAGICSDGFFDEKWLIAPTRRVGFQWLDAVARSGQTVFNVHVKTFQEMAIELASSELDEKNKRFLSGIHSEVIVSRIFGMLREVRPRGYLLGLEPSPTVAATINKAIRDLRLAGLDATRLEPGDFTAGGAGEEADTKAQEMRDLLAEYEKALETGKLLDYAAVLHAAEENARCGQPQGIIIFMPIDLFEEMRELEHRLWEALPCEKHVLEVDESESTCGDDTDLTRLRWVNSPPNAGAPKGDGTAKVFRAVGEVNEVREVFRRCLEEDIPFDEVEVLYTDAATYVPLFYELGKLLASGGGEDIPVTFYEGIPVRYSRPARALMGWLEWVKGDAYPQAVLTRILQDGLIKRPAAEGGRTRFSCLASTLRSLPVYASRERYLDVIERSLASTSSELEDATASGGEDEDEVLTAARKESAAERIECLEALREIVTRLLCDHTGPLDPTEQKRFLAAATSFMFECARNVSEFDRYSAKKILEAMEEMAGYLEDGNVEGLDLARWLSDLARDTHVEGKGPRPGCIFVAPLRLGGHSGRSHTFIVGLDDTRFPGVGLEDPVLLDGERENLSKKKKLVVPLPTAAKRLTRDVKVDFARLLARLRECVTLSYCCRDLAEDSEMFPSRVLLSAFRVLSGMFESGYAEILGWEPLQNPVSFAPASPKRCIDIKDWWLWLAVTAAPGEDFGESLAEFPHIVRGLEARKKRESDLFTEYDGYVSEAGEDFLRDMPGLSPSGLETLGRCPIDYFFKYLLGIMPPEEHEPDAYRWLPADKTGSLMHGVFRDFMVELQRRGEKPSMARHKDLINELVDCKVEEWQTVVPKLQSPGVFEYEVEQMHVMAEEFLLAMEELCQGLQPKYFEVGIGLEQKEGGSRSLSDEPIELQLPGGQRIRVHGRPDRIDLEVEAGGGYVIWDYKTGKKGDQYTKYGPFNRGRLVQSILYMMLFEKACAARGEEVTASEFCYFFPRRGEIEQRVRIGREKMDSGMRKVAALVDMLATGCFPAGDEENDVKYSKYRIAIGDPLKVARTVKAKCENEDNLALEPFIELRKNE